MRRHWDGRVLEGWLLVLLALVTAVMVGLSASRMLPLGRTAIARFDRLILHPRHVAMAAGNPISPPLAVPAAQKSQTPPALPQGLVLGYFYAPGNPPSALASLQKYAKVLNGVIPFWYTIDAKGELSGSTDAQVMRYTVSHHLLTFALVQNPKGEAVFGPLLNDPVARRRAEANLLTLVEANGFNGVNLDWEGLAPKERQPFTTFVQELSRTFHRHGYYVTLSLPAETSDQPSDSWTGAYDYRALGQAADLIMIMAYDQHWSGGNPGPIASNQWVHQVLAYAISVMKPKKVILGIPGYGYDWGSASSSAHALTYTQAVQLKRQYAPNTNGNHFNYVQNGVVHSVWFENTQSFLSKIQLVAGFELHGIALWRIGIEDPKIWNFLQ